MAVVPKQSGIEILRKLIPLNTLPDETLEKLLQQAKFEKLQRGDVLFRQGDENRERVYLLSGRVALMEGDAEVDTVSAGDNLARYPLAHHTPRKFTAVSKHKSEFVRIDNRLLGDMLSRAGSSAYQVEELDEEADDWMAQLLQSKIFQRIPAANIQKVMMNMEEVEVSAGDVVIRQGDEGDYFYLVNKGECVVNRVIGDGDPEELARIRAGDCFGEESLLSDRPRGSSVVMLTDGVLQRLGKEDFVAYVKQPLANPVDYQAAVRQVNTGAVLLDVRTRAEHDTEHLPGSVCLPFSNLRRQIPKLDPEKNHIVYCQDGQLSATAVYLLLEQGLNASVLAGGLNAVPGFGADKAADEKAKVINLRPEQIVKEGELSGGDEQVRGRLEKAEQEARDRSAEKIELQRRLEEALERLHQAEQKGRQEQEQLDEELTRLKASLKQKGMALEAAEERTRAAEARIGKLEKKFEGQLQEKEQALDGIRVERDSAAGKLADLGGDLDAARDELRQVTERAAILQKELEGQQEQVRERDESLVRLEASVKELEKRAREEQEQAVGRLGEIGEERDRLQGELSVLQRQLTDAGTREEELARSGQEHETRLQEADAELASRQEENRTLTEQLEKLKSELSEQQKGIQEQSGKADQAQQESRERITRLEQELEQKEDAFRQLQSDQDGLSVELEGSKEQLKALQESLERERTAVADQSALAAERDRLQQALGEVEAELEGLRSERDEQIRQLGAEDANAAEELKRVQAELDEAIGARDAALSSLAEIEEKTRVLEQQVLQQEQLDEDRSAELSAVQANLEEISRRYEEAETALGALKEAPVASGEGEELKILKAELATLTDALEQSDSEHEEMQRRAEIAGEESKRLSGELSRLREQAEEDVRKLTEELNELRDREPKEVDGKALESLRQELEETRGRLKEREVNGSADAAENAALRQELDDLKASLEERREELARSRRDGQLLEEKIEEGNSEIDRLKHALEMAQVDSEEAEFKRQEANEARQQVEDALYRLQQQVESERPQALSDVRISGGGRALDIDGGGGVKRLVIGSIAGVAIGFAVAELLSVIGGNGEIISGMLGSPPSTGQPMVVQEKRVQPQVRREVVSGAGQKPAAPAAPAAPKPGTVAAQAEPKKPAEAPVVVEAGPRPADKPEVQRVASAKPSKPEETETGTVIRDSLRGGGRAPEMVYVRGGTFSMGSNRSQLDSEEQPVHEVTLKSFAIGRYEVTFDDYSLFTRATGRQLPDDLGWGKGMRPVINVSWNDASAYADWLSRQTGHSYRLATEAEWEYAAAGGSHDMYWWGFQVGDDRANCFNCGSRWDGRQTAPVGSFEPNGYGIHNTAGNVMEWVQDCYHDSYDNAPTDGSAWVDAGCRDRVVRGGAFNKPGTSLRTTKRAQHDADARLFILGFRLVREVKQAP